jgi:hypothetical protein
MKLPSRILTVAKYLPAVLSGLLVVAWVVSHSFVFGAIHRRHINYGTPSFIQRSRAILCWSGSVVVSPTEQGLEQEMYQPLFAWGRSSDVGCVRLFCGRHPPTQVVFRLPIAALLTCLIPLAIAPFIRFRFPLWSWFAFSALVAVELAYYLR